MELTVSEFFWSQVKERMNIIYIYPELRKKQSFDEIHEKILRLLDKIEAEDEFFDAEEHELREFSDEAYELSVYVQKLGLLPDMCTTFYLTRYFQTLFMKNKRLGAIDPEMCDFENLRVLNLAHNNVRRVENLPPRLEELYLSSNQVSEIGGPPNEHLLHLGISYNCLDSSAVASIAKFYPKLFSLDLAFNEMNDLRVALEFLQGMDELRVLVLNGNPMMLLNRSSNCVVQRMPRLRVLDDIPVNTEKEAKKRSGAPGFLSSSERAPSEIAVEEELSVDIEISVLGEIEGR